MHLLYPRAEKPQVGIYMSNATCTKCGKEYNWHAQRGMRLADCPSPCCHAPGRAVGEHKAPPKKICPECGKGGLWWRKAIRDPEIYKLRDLEGFDYRRKFLAMYCPRCEKWVIPTKGAANVQV